MRSPWLREHVPRAVIRLRNPPPPPGALFLGGSRLLPKSNGSSPKSRCPQWPRKTFPDHPEALRPQRLPLPEAARTGLPVDARSSGRGWFGECFFFCEVSKGKGQGWDSLLSLRVKTCSTGFPDAFSCPQALWALEGHRGAELKSLLLAPFHRRKV